jgi:hypothetical protein
MNTNELQVIEQLGSKIDSYVQTVAEKAGQSVEHFWPIFVKQQQIEGMWQAGLFGFFLMCCLSLLFYTMATHKKGWGGQNDINARFITALASGALGLILVVSLGSGGRILGKIYNPEYYAVEQVVKMIKD